MKSWLIALCAALAFGVAQGQDAPPAGKGGAREACKPDADKFCSDVKPGGGRIIACMKQHEDELSPACRAAIGGHGSHKGPPPANPDQPPPKPQ